MFDAYQKGLESISGVEVEMGEIQTRYWGVNVLPTSNVIFETDDKKELLDWYNTPEEGVLYSAIWDTENQVLLTEFRDPSYQEDAPLPPSRDVESEDSESEDSKSGLMMGVAAGLVGVGLVLVVRKNKG